jgi:hypothetical protein
MHPQRHLGLALCLGLLSVVVACGGGSDDGSGGGGDSATYVTPGIDAPIFVAMLSDGTTALVHATDAQMLQATFRGSTPAEGAGFDFTNEEGDSVTATAAGEGFAGSVTFASGGSFDFTIEPVSRNNGGLYRNREIIRDEAWIIGLIVLNDGKIVGAARNEATGVVERRTTLSLGIKWLDPTTDP